MRFSEIVNLAKQAMTDYNRNDPLILASATAFFCLFALPPIIIIIITILGIFVKDETLSSEIFQRLSSTLGESGADQLEEIFRNFRSMTDDLLPSILAFIFFLFIASNLFVMVSKSINQLWGLKIKKSPGWMSLLRSRLLALILVLLGGMLTLISLLADAVVSVIGDGLDYLLPDIGLPAIQVLNILFSLITVTIWFVLIYKILPNAEIDWRPAFVGGAVTALLFVAGKYILGIALVSRDIGSIFGAAGSIILILLFIFYSALIFYYGAVYTKLYASFINKPIRPDDFSETIDRNDGY